MEKQNNISLTIKDDNPQNIEIILAGRLDIHTTASVWDQCINLVETKQPKKLTIDAKNITYCDGAGIALLQKLEQLQKHNQSQYIIKELNPYLQLLLNDIFKHPKKISTPPPKKRYRLTEKFNRVFAGMIATCKDNIIFTGALSYQLFQACLKPHTIRWKDLWFAIEDVGPNALPIIILVGFLIGLITAFQSAIPLGKFGAQIFIANLVGISLVKEMGPLMTAVLLISRTSSAFAAEIGTMKINQEVDALITMGINPIKFLTVPRVLATTLMTPFLSVFMILAGLIGCGVVMHTLGFNLSIYLQQLEKAISMKAFVGGLIKAVVFGIMVAGIGCMHGLKTKMGASAVGKSTTQAVVSGIIMLVIADGIFAVLYYMIGM